MKNVLKVFVLVLVVSCLFVSCSKKASVSASNDTGGSGSTAAGSSGSTAAGSSNASAAGSDNTIKNAVGRLHHQSGEIVFNSWADIPWTGFGLSAAPVEPSGGKLETAFFYNETPFIAMSNISKAAYENLCHEIEAGFNIKGEGYEGDLELDQVLYSLEINKLDAIFTIHLDSKLVNATALLLDEWDDKAFHSEDTSFRIYYFGPPANGIIMTTFKYSYL